MEKVKAEVVMHYRSELVEHLRANGCTFAYGNTGIHLAKEFGFCYGVERAIDLAYAARRHFPKEQPVYILGEIIHNPHVNEQIRNMGLTFLSGGHQAASIDDLGKGDPVVIPAFGTEVGVIDLLNERGCTIIDATCGDVMSVWKRVRQNARDQVTSIIHGKAWHEETKATSSQAKAYENGHYLVVFDLDDTDYVCRYITKGGDREAFLKKFDGAYSDGFDPDRQLNTIGLANQTTMLRSETEEVQRRLSVAMAEKHGEDALDEHFRYFDTICGATQERQDALRDLLNRPMDLLLVVGGYNSSNTSHLVELCEDAGLPTYFVSDADQLISPSLIRHFDWRTKTPRETADWLPEVDGRPLDVILTAGASCPDALLDAVIQTLLSWTPSTRPVDEALAPFEAAPA